MNQLESALRALGDDPGEPAPPFLADRALRRARRRSRRHGVLAALGAATVASLAAVAIAVVDPRTGASPPPAAPASGSPALAPRTNVLLLGTDAGPGRTGVRPDTIILASVDTRTGDTVLLSLPRSLPSVPFPPGSPGARAWPDGFDCRDCLLNGVWAWAENDPTAYRGAPDPGLTATRDAVEAITGQPVDETVTIDMQGLGDLVDALGGVEVTVRERLPIGGSSADRVADAWIEKGRQRLDGFHALWYARSRWTTDDHDRRFRQQCLLRAVLDQVRDVRGLSGDYPRIAAALGRSLSTSIPAADLRTWVDLATRKRGARVLRVGLPQISGEPDYDRIRTSVQAAIDGHTAGGAPTAPDRPDPDRPDPASPDPDHPDPDHARGDAGAAGWSSDARC